MVIVDSWHIGYSDCKDKEIHCFKARGMRVLLHRYLNSAQYFEGYTN